MAHRLACLELWSLLSEPMSQSVLVEFFEMTITVVLEDRKACFSHDVTQLIHAFPLHFLCPLVFFVAIGCRLTIEPKADTECNRGDRFAAEAAPTSSSWPRFFEVPIAKSGTRSGEDCSESAYLLRCAR